MRLGDRARGFLRPREAGRRRFIFDDDSRERLRLLFHAGLLHDRGRRVLLLLLLLLFVRRREIERIDVNVVVRRRAGRMVRVDLLDVLEDLRDDLGGLLLVERAFLREQLVGQEVRLRLLNVGRVNVHVVVVHADVVRSDVTQIGGVLHGIARLDDRGGWLQRRGIDRRRLLNGCIMTRQCRRSLFRWTLRLLLLLLFIYLTDKRRL